MSEADRAGARLGLLDGQIEADPRRTADQLRRLLADDPLNAQAYRLLAKALDADENAGSGAADALVSASGGQLPRARQALEIGDLETAEIILRRTLRVQPDNDEALQLLAELAARLGYEEEAESLVRLAIELAPATVGHRMALAAMLYRRNRPDEAIELLDDLLSMDGTSLDALNLKAAALARAGRLHESVLVYEESLRLEPTQARTWSSYGQALRTLGRFDQSVAAIRRGIESAPLSGELWWSLSDLKTHRFGDEDARRMEAALARSMPGSIDRIYLHFALGKALADCGAFATAFAHYAEGNRLQKRRSDYDASEVTNYVEAAGGLFSTGFFRERAGWGVEEPDAIFVVGMPRSGSTLVEQILGSHSEIEATMELPDLVELAEGFSGNLNDLPGKLTRAPKEIFEELGCSYLDRTRRYRKTSRPLFVDKMPNNWLYIPIILLALPNSKIIDIRREPLDCCVSNFKQMFLSRQGFSNDLSWLGQYYRDYVVLMRHVDRALPGRVHRVIYEDLVENSEREIGRLLDYVGVPFEAACLRHHEGERLVRTTSADQVRQPINRNGIGSWRAFEPWLGPLKQSLGDVSTSYRD